MPARLPYRKSEVPPETQPAPCRLGRYFGTRAGTKGFGLHLRAVAFRPNKESRRPSDAQPSPVVERTQDYQSHCSCACSVKDQNACRLGAKLEERIPREQPSTTHH